MISETESVSSIVRVDISATYDEWLKSGLSYNWTHSKTLGIQCNSLPTNRGDVWEAFPAEYKYKFRVSSEFSDSKLAERDGTAFEVGGKGFHCEQVGTERANTAVIVPGCPK